MKGRNRRTARVAMALFMTLAMIFPMTANATVAENDVARIGDEGYETLQAAFGAVPDGTTTTVTGCRKKYRSEYERQEHNGR